MNPDELKLRLSAFVNGIIDDIFPNNDIFNKLKSATAKFWIEQNLWKLDSLLSQFKDASGNIDITAAERIYTETLFDENGRFCINIRDLIPNESISKYLPDSAVLFTKDDLHKLFNNNGKTDNINHIN